MTMEEEEEVNLENTDKCNKKHEQKEVKKLEQRLFKCPSLGKDFKLQNIKDFCSGAEKTDTLVEENGGTSIQYTKILDKDRKTCEAVTQLYNLCIDSDNMLYPESNYQRCFSPENALYMCSKFDKYDEKDSKQVNLF
jgi:hypothetical protein